MTKSYYEDKKSFFSKIYSFLKIFIIFFVILYIGVIIGYSVVGNGSLIDALDLTAVRHIINIIFN